LKALFEEIFLLIKLLQQQLEVVCQCLRTHAIAAEQSHPALRVKGVAAR